jgi:ankyrin repeat protein
MCKRDGVRELQLQGLTPLLLAAQDGNAEMVRALIEAKADQTIMEYGKTPAELLVRATAAKKSNVAQALAESAVDVNMRNAVRVYGQG